MNRFLEQVRLFWTQLGLNQKFSLILAFFAVIVGMAVVLTWSGRPRMSLLYGNMDPAEMADVIQLIQEQGVDYEISGGGRTIMVPKDQVYSLRMSLAAQGLPSGGGVGFEIFDQGNFGISDFVQRTNYLRAVQGELARTITQLNGVRTARVMVVIPENRLIIGDNEARPSASVFVDTGGKRLETSAVDSIRHLVANSVEGLRLDDVAVIDSRGNVLSEALRSDESLGSASSQLKYQKELEHYYSSKIESMLSPIVGPGGVVARVSVDINTSAQTRRDITFDPDSAVVRSQTQTEEQNQSDERKPSQVAGTASNIATENGDDPTGNEAVTSSTDVVKNRSTQYEINSTTVETIQSPGTVERLSAAVFVSQQRDPETGAIVPRDEEEINNLRQMVANVLGLAPEDPVDALITVRETVFSYAEELRNQPPPGIVEQVVEYSDIIRNFIALIVAVGIFMIFVRMLKRYRPEPVVMHPVKEESNEENKKIAPSVTPELLNELIASKPENVGTALQDWVNSGQ